VLGAEDAHAKDGVDGHDEHDCHVPGSKEGIFDYQGRNILLARMA